MQKIIPAILILVLLLFSAGCTQFLNYPSAMQPPAHLPGLTNSSVNSTSGNLTVHFIYIGQGDSTLIQSPEGKTMLIDAGPTASSSRLVAYLKSQGISSLDIVLATHSHEDHIGGMQEVLKNFPVGQFIYNGFPGTTSYYEDLMKTISKKKILLTNVSAGDTIDLDPTLTIDVLNPQKTFFDDPNNNSVVLRLIYRNETFLFTGDAAQGAESAMLSDEDNLSADVLKVGHHGDSRSSSTKFLKAVHPEIAVIEDGYNNDHHNPSNITLNRLKAANVTLYRTDLNGTVTIESDGSSLRVTTQTDYPAYISILPLSTVQTYSAT
jgi:competence protein ComEC